MAVIKVDVSIEYHYEPGDASTGLNESFEVESFWLTNTAICMTRDEIDECGIALDRIVKAAVEEGLE